MNDSTCPVCGAVLKRSISEHPTNKMIAMVSFYCPPGHLLNNGHKENVYLFSLRPIPMTYDYLASGKTVIDAANEIERIRLSAFDRPLRFDTYHRL